MHQNLTLSLRGEYDEFGKYANSSNRGMQRLAVEIIETGMMKAEHALLSDVVISILDVRKGSVIIDYILTANSYDSLTMAVSNIDASIGSETVIGNITLVFSSNSLLTSSPTTSPTLDPTQSPTTNPTAHPTQSPTMDPSAYPTTSPTSKPTSNPSISPTANPTAPPTVLPTSMPTSAPTPGDIFCGDTAEARHDGNWEYHLHIENDSIVTFDTCSSYLNPFSMTIHTIDKFISLLSYAECVWCGSICYPPSQFRVAMSADTYLMRIDQKHYFEMICEPEPHPTTEPTAPLTTHSPTTNPSEHPTEDPTTSHPTVQVIVVNVTFDGNGAPLSSTPYLSDPFGRFEASITVVIDDESGALGDVIACKSCFIWQYQANGESEWKQFDHDTNPDISVSIIKHLGEYTTKLVVQSIRRSNAGNCVDDDAKTNHPFQEDTEYRLRVKFVSSTDYFVSEISKEFSFSTNELTYGGICIIQNVDNLLPLDPYNLFCTGWSNEENLEYNALIGDVAMSTAGFVDDARAITGIAPVGNVSITVLVKEQNEYNAITCFEIKETFKSIEDIINDVPENETSTEVVESILMTIDNITSTNSLSENPDMAVSIHTVVEDMFKSNLTSADEAEQIVDDMVVNILETSTVVASVNESASNISGNAIITELATVSSITSNEEIVDAETTTTQLVEEYLPDIFDAVDLFVEISSARNASGSSNDSTARAEVQDALYSIGEQSQELISNLEATLVDAARIDNASSTTERDIDSINSLSASLVDFATLAASTALAQSEVGETFNFEETEYDDNGTVISSKTVVATKFVADAASSERPVCGTKEQRIEMPETFVLAQEGTFDCAFMASTRNNFVPKSGWNVNRRQTSNGIVTANIYGSRQKRRRLAETVEFETDECSPYLISIEVANTSIDTAISFTDSSNFPSCDFWNTGDSFWDTEGCFVHDITNESVICGCTHLTTFSVSADEIWPEPNYLTEIDWRNLTISNLLKYPTVVCLYSVFYTHWFVTPYCYLCNVYCILFQWITALAMFIVFLIVCLINPRSSKVDSKSVIAFQDIIFKSTQEDKLWKDVTGKEIKYYSGMCVHYHFVYQIITLYTVPLFPEYTANHHLLGLGLRKQLETPEDRKSMMLLTWNLFKLYLRNDHTLLSIFQRTAGM